MNSITVHAASSKLHPYNISIETHGHYLTGHAAYDGQTA